MSTIDISIIQYARAFSVVAETLSIRKAAEILHLTPSAVSYQIAKLEEQVGITLFERQPGHNLRLLQPGQELLVQLPPLFGAVCRLQEEINRINQHQEHVRVGVIAGLAGIALKAIMQNYELENAPLFTLESYDGMDLCHKMLIGEIDFSIFFYEYLQPAFEYVPLFSAPMVLAVPESMAGEVDPQKPEDAMKRLPVIINRGGSYLKSLDACDMLSIKPHVCMYVNNASLALSAVTSGMGVAIIAQSALPAHVEGVRLFTFGGAQLSRRVVLAYMPERIWRKEHVYFKEHLEKFTDFGLFPLSV